MSAVSADDPTDPDLLRQFVAGGDETAFARLVGRHGGLVLSTALRRSGSREIAQEAAQNVFATLARKAARLEAQARTQGSLAPWLHRAAALEAAALARRETRHQHAMRRHQHDPACQPLAFEADATWQQVRAVVDDALASLATADRRVLLLHHVEGRTFPEMASVLGQSEAAVQRRTHRALQRLADRLRRLGVGVPALALSGALSGGFAGEAAASVAAPSLTAAALAQAKMVSASGIGTMLHTWLTSPAALAAVFLLSAAAPAGWHWAQRAKGESTPPLAAPATPPSANAQTAAASPPAEITPETRLNFLRQALAQLSRTPPDDAPTPLGLQLRRYMLGLSVEELRPVAEVLTASETQHLEVLTVIEAFNARLAELEPRTALMLVLRNPPEPPDPVLTQCQDQEAIIDTLARQDFPMLLAAARQDADFAFLRWPLLAQYDGLAVIEMMQQVFPYDARAKNTVNSIISRWIATQPEKAMPWLDQNIEAYPQMVGEHGFISALHRMTAKQAVAVAESINDPLLRSVWLKWCGPCHLKTNPEELAALAPMMRPDDSSGGLSVRSLVWAWRTKDAKAVTAWVASLPEGELKTAAEHSLATPNPFESPPQ